MDNVIQLELFDDITCAGCGGQLGDMGYCNLCDDF